MDYIAVAVVSLALFYYFCRDTSPEAKAAARRRAEMRALRRRRRREEKLRQRHLRRLRAEGISVRWK